MDGITRRRFVQGGLTAGGLALLPRLARAGKRQIPAPGAPEGFEPAYLALERSGELKHRERELWAQMSNCRLCPRHSEVDRIKGQTDVCKSTARLKISSAFPHRGEEAPLSGRGGSGTIFFSRCSLLCVFCQNWEIAHRGDGKYHSHEDLAGMMLKLQALGCHNINLVTPTHVVPHFVRALRIAIPYGLKLPLVYNTGGYDDVETLKQLDGVVDIYLPDYKFLGREEAGRYLYQAEDYPEKAGAALAEMHRQVGDLKTDGRGIARRGVMLRHLVMPNNQARTDLFVKWVARELSASTYVNLMAQYRPCHKAHDYPLISRALERKEFMQARKWAEAAGLTRIST